MIRPSCDSRMNRRISRARTIDRAMTGVFTSVGGFVLLLIIALAAYIIISGFLSYHPGFLSFGPDGIGNQIFNTIYLVFLSLIISVGIGMPAGIYMAEYAPDNKLTGAIRIAIESLSSLPSIVVGLFGYLVFILMVGAQWNLFAGALAVSILNLPLVTTQTEAAIRAVPRPLSYGSAALGATHWHTITHVLIPAGLPSIVTGIMLAAQRGFGEAAALLYTAGQTTVLNWANMDPTALTSPLNPFRPGETLALHVWMMRTEGALNPLNADMASFSSAILVIIALFFSVLVNIGTAKVHARQAGLSPASKKRTARSAQIQSKNDPEV